MQLSKSFEQGIYVILMLQIKGQGQALKSTYLSQELQVSDSSLKKVLRKLVLAHLIESVASKDGGFLLARPINQISLKDILLAVEGPHPIKFHNSHLASQIFDQGHNTAHLMHSQQSLLDTLDSAENAYLDRLDQFTLNQLLEK